MTAHTAMTEYSCKTYWKGGAACGRENEPDRVELTPANGRWPSIDFALPRQRHELEKVERLMQYAYAAGQVQNKRAVAALIKELIAI